MYYSLNVNSFTKNKNNVESVQRKTLTCILQNLSTSTKWSKITNLSYEELQKIIPVATYHDYESEITTLTQDIVRLEPTSGSTENRKWIPYSKYFLNEINHAATTWLGDLYSKYPQIQTGQHYWALSWLPEDLRARMNTNDADLFPWYQRFILKNTMLVPPQIAHVKKAEAAWWATLLHLTASVDLTLVSVWSPTLWIKICDDLWREKEIIFQALTSRTWIKFSEELQSELGPAPKRNCKKLETHCKENFFQTLWPNLTVISAWDSSTSHRWAEEIKTQFPNVSFQGKGLWTTEGVVTIPFSGKKVLAYQSHFFEFIDLKSEKIYPAWQLQKNREYQPVLWTSTGLLRYKLPDRIKLIDFYGDVPCFEFIGRLSSTDMVGEKMNVQWVESLLKQNPEWKGLTLVACTNPKPKYHLFHQSKSVVNIEFALQSLHHYKVARELGQLAPATASYVESVFEIQNILRKNQILGQSKIEVLVQTVALEGIDQ